MATTTPHEKRLGTGTTPGSATPSHTNAAAPGGGGITDAEGQAKLLTKEQVDLVNAGPVDDSALDAAGRFLSEVGQRHNGLELLAPWTPQEEKRIKRKADCIVIALLLIALMMGAVDKVALSTAAVLGLREDLNLTGSQFSLSASLIFIGAIPSVFPALFLIQKFRTGKIIAINVMIWGIITICVPACTNFGGLAACRFVMGFFEAVTFPGFTLVIASWYTRREALIRTALVFSTLSSLTNGLLSYASSFVSESAAVARWQVLYLIVGAITLIVGGLMLWLLPDAPYSAWWLTERERVIAVQRLRDNDIGVINQTLKIAHIKEALLDPKTHLIFLINLCINVPNGGTSTFNSIIVRQSLGFDVQPTLLLAIPTGIVSWSMSLTFSYIATKTRQRCLCAAAACIPSLIGTILLYTIPRSNIAGSLVGLYMVFGYWAPYVVMNTVLASNTGGHTKRSTAYGIAYCGYLVGNLVGPQTFRESEAPDYPSGIAAMLSCYCVALLLIITYYFYIRYLRTKKARYLEAHPEEAEAAAELDNWLDLTDGKNPRFKYVI